MSGISVVYLAAAVLSLLMLAGCLLIVRKSKRWFVLLFSSVWVVNVGYFILSVSKSLQPALEANRIAYFGSVFLPFAMLIILLKVTGVKTPRLLIGGLLALAAAVFLIAASPGVLDLYYKEVSFEVINGTGRLMKVYGALHPFYMVYLLGYFGAMVFFVFRAIHRKTVESHSQAIILVIAVFVNLFVWLIEQLAPIDFEFLAVSYIISELFLLGIHLMLNETQQLKEILGQVQGSPSAAFSGELPQTEPIAAEKISAFCRGREQLTPTERAIFEAYVARRTTKETMALLGIKENTLKYHNKNIYGKLGISSRKELLELYQQVECAKEKLT